MTEEIARVEVSRRINAPASAVFDLLADPDRHREFDGSHMLDEALVGSRITGVGQTFTIKMHRLGREYEMINHVVAFEQDQLLAWEPSPGDVDTAGGDPERVGVPSGYRWEYRLVSDGDLATKVTESFDCGPEGNRWILERDEGGWINGHNSILESMTQSLKLLEQACLGEDNDDAALDGGAPNP